MESCDHSKVWVQFNMGRYRSGHNEAVLKTVSLQGHVGSNPTRPAIYKF